MTDTYHGLLVIDKPAGITSRAALDRCQGWFPRGTALGHTGTLDPLATGVLVLCVGRATRLAEYVQQMPKTYSATFHLGATSDSDDADGTLTAVDVTQPPTRTAIAATLQTFVGEIDQVPPAYSAAKVTGRRAYALARRGEMPELAARRVHVHAIDLLAYDYPRLDVVVHCGKGTYIRSLARDLGTQLGCGAHVTSLRRERVGPFAMGQALALEAGTEEARSRLRPLSEAVAELPALTLASEEIGRLRHGQRLLLAETSSAQGTLAIFDEHGRFIAVARAEDGLLHPEKVMPE
jgi:tRNA pseudouridine55 synthase